jgi:hypothetical protein
MKQRKPIPRKPNKVETPKTVYNRKMKQLNVFERGDCPKCHTRLFHFSGPDYFYCSICEYAYD